MVNITYADGSAEKKLLEDLKARSGSVSKTVTETVSKILEDVKNNGDNAVREYTVKFDGKAPESFEIDKSEIENAVNRGAFCSVRFSSPATVKKLSRISRAQRGISFCSISLIIVCSLFIWMDQA